MKGFIYILFGFIFIVSCNNAKSTFNETIDLSGNWMFQLDPKSEGINRKWYNESFSDSVKLPGTTDENKKGVFKNEHELERLSRVWYWKGAAWYQKEVDIPEHWVGKNVNLLLERTKDTYVWFDDVNCGYENTLSAPQYFNLTKAIKPSKHKITVLVDNAKLPPVGPSHAVDERTQTNWNGIVGKIELQATDPVWIEEVQAYPDVKNNRVKIRVNIGNIINKEANGELLVSAESWNTEKPVKFQIQKQEIAGITKDKVVEFIYNFDQDAPLWDEFDPALIKLNFSLSVNSDDKNYSSSKQIDFGMREFKREGRYIKINGKRVFLRGRTDSANYPLTGYPPMDLESWLKMFKQLKAYGINHWRFHSWCPPDQAMMAADIIGIYLQPEEPNKRSGMDKKSLEEEDIRKIYNADYLEVDTSIVNMNLKDYLQKEGELIFKYFGNHPSFTMFTLGNELGRNQGMYDLVSHFQQIDSRRLYAQGSNNMSWAPSYAEGDDFHVTAYGPGKVKEVRGSYAEFTKYTKGIKNPHIEDLPPSTLKRYTDAIEGLDFPVIGHETGQFQVSPDFDDISEFTGVTRARNYEIFRERFKQANLLDQADDFVQASGRLAVICYREDIEAALRTPDFGGVQLLDLQDFPGQGTALVGILNDFMEPKGLIEPHKWREFCSEVVPLLIMEKYVWTNSETFNAGIEIAHYGKIDFRDTNVTWKFMNSKGEVLHQGIFNKNAIERGELVPIGALSFPLDVVKEAEKCYFEISIEGTPYKNGYNLWVYPELVNTKIPEGILVTESLDVKAKAHMDAGGKAIIIPDHKKLLHSIRGGFQTDFWCYPMFAKHAKRIDMEPAPGSLGFICNPDSPLLANFPTEFHSNWQWWQLVKNCKPIILDDTPADYKPLIQTIDNFDRNHKLGMVFETKYGKGSALICAIDLLNLQDKPEARQLYYSMLNYVDSEDFAPDIELSRDVLHQILP